MTIDKMTLEKMTTNKMTKYKNYSRLTTVVENDLRINDF